MTTAQPTLSESLETASFSFAEWREQFLLLILRGAIVIGLIVAIVASIDTPAFLVVTYVVSYVIILIITFAPLSYQVRAIGFLSVMMALAVSALLQTGIRADARLFLLAFVVMGGMLFGHRGGRVALWISLIPIAITAFLITTGRYTIISITIGGNEEVLTWIVATLVLVLVETLILTGLDLLQRGFETAMQQSRHLYDEILAERASLERRVEARTAQLQASAEVGQAAAAILDPTQLLRQVTTLISERFGFYYAAVFTLNETGTAAVLREATGEAGRNLKERHHQLELAQQSMVGYAISQRKARIALDVGRDPVRFANPLLPDTRSEIALPLIAGKRVLGALDVQSTEAAAFDEASAAVLQAMADQIAVALNNAEQFRKTQQQAERQSKLNQFGRVLFSATSMEDLYRALAAGLRAVIPHDYLSLALAQGAVLREYQLRDGDELALRDGPEYALPTTLCGRVFTRRHLATSYNLADDAQLEDAAQLARLGYRSALSLPLNIGEHILGTLNLASRQPAAFQMENAAWFEQLAGQVGAALETRRLAQAQQTSLREMEVLTRQLSGQAWAKRWQRQPEEIVQYARSGIAAELPTSTPELEAAIVQHAPLARSQPDDADQESLYQAALAVPIVLRGEVLGGLQVSETNRSREWSEDDLTFMQAVADQVALALDNARLIEETQQRAERERLVADISSRMFAANDLESIVHIAGEELGRILQVKQTTVKVHAESAELSTQPGNGQSPDQHV